MKVAILSLYIWWCFEPLSVSSTVMSLARLRGALSGAPDKSAWLRVQDDVFGTVVRRRFRGAILWTPVESRGRYSFCHGLIDTLL